MLAPGTILGDRYEIVEKIGAGGMSIVYKAKDNRLQRFVAIKELREEFAKDDEFVAKFRKEALAAASLSHPNIVGIFDVGNDHDIHYIVMEYVEGKTLKELVTEEGPFSSKMVLEFAEQIVLALRHAHKKKIIHRDIKPQNILITNDHVLKVTDFGIAKAVDSSTVVATGNAIGSVHYFSPEQAKGKYVNETSDLYSCGIVLFELATRRLPFEADSHISIALKHINEELPKPSEFNPNILFSLEQLILKATRKSQSERYQNADEMLRDIKGILQNPNYIVKMPEVSEQTILLSPAETAFIRNNGNINNGKETQGLQENMKKGENDPIYEEDTAVKQLLDNDDDQQVSTFYKVLVSVGGVLATLAIVVVISLACVLWIPSMGKAKTVNVPNVKGRTVEMAKEFLKSYKLDIGQITEEVSDEAEPGTIISQNPGENTTVKRNSKIDVTIAIADTTDTGTSTTETVPDVVGLDRKLAEETLDKLDFKVVFDPRSSDTVELGNIIEQIPRANEIVKRGSQITLVVSTGPSTDLVRVPNLSNLTVDKARESLNNVSLNLGGQTPRFSDTVAEGLIIEQSVGVNTEVEAGTAIDVVVSKGKEPAPEPTEEPTPEESPNTGEQVEPSSPVETPEVSLSFPIVLPQEQEGKDSYHVVAKLTTEYKSEQVYNGEVAFDQFPLTITMTGRGEGKLDVYIDDTSTIAYQEKVNFNEE